MEIDEKKLRSIGKQLRKHLEAALQLARDAGTKNPVLYFESEGGVYIMDRDHPNFFADSCSKRQQAIVGTMLSALPDGTDVGAW